MDILTQELTDDEIIRQFMAYKHGLIAYWELERGSYDIVERNAPGIDHFINSFRKAK